MGSSFDRCDREISSLRFLGVMDLLKERNGGGNKVSLRQPLVPSGKNNVARNHWTNKPPRFLPPNHHLPSPSSTSPRPTLLPKRRSQSADRRRHSTSTAPSTPVCDSVMVDLRLSSHRCGGGGGRTLDGPWPSMRSLTSAFQSETISIPITKKDKSSVGITNSTENRRSSIEKKKKKKTATNTTAFPDRESKVVDHRRWPSVATVTPITTTNMPSLQSLTYIADVRKGKKTRNNIEEAHRLKVSYNRYLQWRFVNARSEDVMAIKKITMEDSVYNTWITISALRDSVILKKVSIQRLNQALKLDSILVSQMSYLEDWLGLEREHSCSLTGGIAALKASTLRLPVTGGTKVDYRSLKDSINSAIDTMRFLGSSICSLLSKVKNTNAKLSELSNLALEETFLLNECRDLLASTASMQVKESSLRMQLLQLKHHPAAR